MTIGRLNAREPLDADRHAPTDGDLLTLPEVRRHLRLSRAGVYALVASGRLPAYRVGATVGARGRLLVARADLDAFLAASRVVAPVGAQDAPHAGTSPAPPGKAADIDLILERLRAPKKPSRKELAGRGKKPLHGGHE